MKKYMVTAEVTISMHVIVTAKNAKEAKAIAEDYPVMSLCHQCARGSDDEEWVTSGELDGEPTNLRAEEFE